MREAVVSVPGGDLWTASTGEGIPVLLCSGGPGCCDYLGPVAAMIDDMAMPIRFDQRGCGRSPGNSQYDMHGCIADMESIRKAYGVDRWIVAGHSWGSELCLAYAVSHQERVLGIIGISGGVIHKDREWSAQYHRLKETIGEREPTYDYPPNMEVNRSLNASWRAFARQPRLLRAFAELDVPALFIYGSEDIRPSWPVRQTAALLPQGQFVLIEDAAHVIWHSHGGSLERHLRQFIEQCKGESHGDSRAWT